MSDTRELSFEGYVIERHRARAGFPATVTLTKDGEVISSCDFDGGGQAYLANLEAGAHARVLYEQLLEEARV